MDIYGIPLILVLLLGVTLALHAYKTGDIAWMVVNLLIPVFGNIAYVALKVLPSIRDSVQSSAKVATTSEDMNGLKVHESSVDDVLRWADESLLTDANSDEAIAVYERALLGDLPDAPNVLFKLSRAYFAKKRFVDARDMLDRLRRESSFSLTGAGHLLYARVLEELNSPNDAVREYESLVRYYDGAEAKCRYGMLLKRLGYAERARNVFDQVLTDAKDAKPTYRMTQRAWIDLANQEVFQMN